MPIGTVDYVSTAAWNDPFNPWPAYFQVSLSAADIPPVILTLTYFNPNTDLVVSYADDAGDYLLNYDATGEHHGYGASWVVMGEEGSTSLYYKPTLTRAIPVKVTGVADGWELTNGSDQTTLYIQPVFTSLNPWEFRRRRLLEIC